MKIDEIKIYLEEKLGRIARANELANIETDALLLAQFAMKKIEELEDRLKKLEK